MQVCHKHIFSLFSTVGWSTVEHGLSDVARDRENNVGWPVLSDNPCKISKIIKGRDWNWQNKTFDFHHLLHTPCITLITWYLSKLTYLQQLDLHPRGTSFFSMNFHPASAKTENFVDISSIWSDISSTYQHQSICIMWLLHHCYYISVDSQKSWYYEHLCFRSFIYTNQGT